MANLRASLRVLLRTPLALAAAAGLLLAAPPGASAQSAERHGFVERVDAAQGELTLAGGGRLLVVDTTRVSDAQGRLVELATLRATPDSELPVLYRGRPGPTGLVLEWLRVGVAPPE